MNGKNPAEPATIENQVLVVRDHDKFWQVCQNLLAELQEIKANRQKEKLEALMATVAPLNEIKESWAQAIIHRGEDLKINYASFDQSWIIDADLNFKIVSDTPLEGVSKGWSKIGYLK